MLNGLPTCIQQCTPKWWSIHQNFLFIVLICQYHVHYLFIKYNLICTVLFSTSTLISWIYYLLQRDWSVFVDLGYCRSRTLPIFGRCFLQRRWLLRFGLRRQCCQDFRKSGILERRIFDSSTFVYCATNTLKAISYPNMLHFANNSYSGCSSWSWQLPLRCYRQQDRFGPPTRC